MTLDLLRLEALATAATPGEWGAARHEHGRTRYRWDVIAPIDGHPANMVIAEMPGGPNDKANASYIAAVPPGVVLGLIARIRELELKYRARLWLGHGHTGQYGDDGEMQCSACAPFGAWDYKRKPLEELEATIYAVALARTR